MSNETSLEKALQAAQERSKEWTQKLRSMTREELIEEMARRLFYAIEHDPYGYPNGRATWDEIPEIDENFEIGMDKERYRVAAGSFLDIVLWVSQPRIMQ